jgi:hypothetical protein
MTPTGWTFRYVPHGPLFRVWTDGERFEARKIGHDYEGQQ